MDLHFADIFVDYKIKTNETRLKIKKIKRYDVEKEKRLHVTLGALVILIVIIIIMYVYLYALGECLHIVTWI